MNWIMTTAALAASVTLAGVKTWTGAVNGTWDTSTLNWVDENGAAAAFADNDDAVFADTVALTNTVTISGSVTAGVVTFTNNATYYLLNGGAISTATQFNKSGTGTLNIASVTHTYKGDVLIAGGTVLLSGSNDVKDTLTGGLGNPRFARTVTVTNATLSISGRNPYGGAGTSTLPILADLRMYNSTLNALLPIMGYNFGNVHFENTAINYSSGAKTNDARWWGTFLFGLDAYFGGTTPFVFRDPDVKQCAITLGKWKDSAITVEDITGDAAGDVVLDIALANVAYDNGINTHFTKNGPGTLVLATNCGIYSTYTGDVSVTEGTLKITARAQYGDLNPTHSCLGNPQVAHTICIGTNATLQLSASDILGQAKSLAKMGITVDGGTLAQDSGMVNCFGPLTLNNAKLSYTGYNQSIPDIYGHPIRIWGTFIFNGDVRFSGTNAYNLARINGSSLKVGANGSRMAYLDIDDITGDDAADLTIRMPILDMPGCWWSTNENQWGNLPAPSRVGKKGPGRLLLADDAALSDFTGDFDISNGVVEVTAGGANASSAYGPLGNPLTNRTVIVEPGAELYLHRSDVSGQLSKTNLITLAVTNGTLRLADSTCNQLGSLDLYDATLIYNGGTASYSLWGVFGLGAKARFDGTKPYDLPEIGANCRISLGYLTDEEDPGPALLKGKTEFNICDITGDGADDVTIRPALQDIPYWTGRMVGSEYVHFSCGLKKTGPGTLRLTGANVYTGDTEVVEGALMIDGASSQSAVTARDGGTVGGSGVLPGLTIAEGGGFEALFGQTAPLRVAELTLAGTNHIVHARNLIGAETKTLRVPLVTFGTLNGKLATENWAVDVDGVTLPHKVLNVFLRGDTLWAHYGPPATVITLR
jgi:fibronectin-binding autotransporter adhesin